MIPFYRVLSFLANFLFHPAYWLNCLPLDILLAEVGSEHKNDSNSKKV